MAYKVNILGTVEHHSYKDIDATYSIIEELAINGVNAICFSVHADNESGLTPFDFTQWSGIKKYCDALNIEFIGRPRALCAVECCEELGVSKYRIAAEEVGNFPLLEKLARTEKELIISAPPGLDWQIERMIDFIQPYDNNVVLMQWMPFFPCQSWDWGLKRMEWLKNHFGYKIGLCDRSGDVFASAAAIAMGAEYVEFRISEYPEALRKKFIEGIRKVESSLQVNPDSENFSLSLAYKGMFERSIIINKDKKKGMMLTLEDIEIIEDSRGIDVSRYYDVVGKYLIEDVKRGEMLDWSHLQHDLQQ